MENADHCKKCKKANSADPVPAIVFEEAMMRNERNIKRLVIALVVAALLIFFNNIAWLYYFNQFETDSYSVDIAAAGAGNANYIGEDGNITNELGE